MKGAFDIRLQGPGLSRVGKLSLRGLELPTPSYVPAFSSVRDEDLMARLDTILVRAYPLKSFLMSALDLDRVIDAGTRPRLMRKLKTFAADHIMFLDSGSYELGRRAANGWGTPEVLRVATQAKPHVVVAFDPFPPHGKLLDVGRRLRGEIEAAKKAFKRFPSLRERLVMTFVLRSNTMTNPLDQVAKIAGIVANNRDWVDILAFPDVDIGPDMLVRCRFARELRGALQSRDLETPIHVLGCSEPLSMVMYSLSGADLFDGNGWWDRTIDATRMSYQDLSYLRLLGCKCAACRSVDLEHAGPLEYGSAVMGHNLLQYDALMGDVRNAIIQGTFEQLFKRSPIGREAQRLLDLLQGVN